MFLQYFWSIKCSFSEQKRPLHNVNLYKGLLFLSEAQDGIRALSIVDLNQNLFNKYLFLHLQPQFRNV